MVTQRIGGPMVTQTLGTTPPVLMSLTVPLSDGSAATAVPVNVSSEAATNAAVNRPLAKRFKWVPSSCCGAGVRDNVTFEDAESMSAWPQSLTLIPNRYN